VIPFRMRRLQFVDFRTDYGLPLQSLLQVLARQPREPGGGNLPQEPPVVPSQAGSPGSAETIPTRDASVLTRKTAVGRPHEASSFVDPSQPGPGDVDLRSDRPPGFLQSLSKAIGLRQRRPSILIRGAWFLAGVSAVLAVGFQLSPLVTRHSPHSSVPLPVPLSILTSLPGMERAPSFSPDGKQVTYTWSPTRTDASYVCVQMVGANAAPLRLTPKPASTHRPAWSREGSQIAFLPRDGRHRSDAVLMS